MKYKILLLLIVVTTLSSNSCHPDKVGCKDPGASNYDVEADLDCNNCCIFPPKKGALLFWTSDASKIVSCGALTIKLSNGQQANITGYYFAAPSNCVNQFGGYFHLEEGTYTYQVTTGNSSCSIPGGTVTVTGDRCNLARIQ